MQERVIENWLDNADERSLQLAFCSVLIEEGHTILHVTRHCGMEMGKDIITIDKNSIPCAFQLKNVNGKKLNLTRYRDDVEKQLIALAYSKIIHPSIDTKIQHKSYLVLNGELEEEVSRSIDDFNRELIDRGKEESKVNVIVKGNLYAKFFNIKEKIWPDTLTDIKTFLEIYLDDGSSVLPKEKFANLMYNSLPFCSEKPLSRKNYMRSVLSLAVIVSSVLLHFTKKNNHTTEFEAWIIYISYCFALAEKNNIQLKNELNFAIEAAFNSIYRLAEEVVSSENIDSSFDINQAPIYNVKYTYLLSLLSVFGLSRGNSNENIDVSIKNFCRDNFEKMFFWGEYCIPQFIAYFIYSYKFGNFSKRDSLIHSIIKLIITYNNPRGKKGISNPYYAPDDILPFLLNIEPSPINDSFLSFSFSIEALLHLFVRLNWKQEIKFMWPEITKISLNIFKTKESWQNYLFNSDEGQNFSINFQPTKEWRELKNESWESEGNEVPLYYKENPILYLAFLLVFPHRLNSSGIRWLHSYLLDLSFSDYIDQYPTNKI